MVLRASEIGQYVYCPMAWWLRRQGHEPDSVLLEQGKRAHEVLGKSMVACDRGVRVLWWLVGGALVCFTLGFVVFFLGVF